MIEYKELLKNWEQFMKVVQNPLSMSDNVTAVMLKRYSEHNVEIINEILLCSIDHLNRLQKTKSMNDVICAHAQLTDDMRKKMMRATQKFFNASLENVSDYNEWLKTHCDFATD